MANHDVGMVQFLLFYQARAFELQTYTASLLNGIMLWSGNNFFQFNLKTPLGNNLAVIDDFLYIKNIYCPYIDKH